MLLSTCAGIAVKENFLLEFSFVLSWLSAIAADAADAAAAAAAAIIFPCFLRYTVLCRW